MAVQPYPYIALTDGTTTVEFANGLGTPTVCYIVRGEWAPTIAPLREGELGGRGPYENVEEEFTCDIKDTTAALVLAKLTTLNLLLEQARRWAKGENVAQVTFLYAPQGSTTLSTASPLKYVVYGRAPGDETSGRNHVIVSKRFNDLGMMSVLFGLNVRFYRHGVGTQGSQNASSASTANGAKTTVTMPAATGVPSPTRISINTFGYGNSTTYKFESCFFAVAEASEDLQVNDASGLAPATDYTSVADAGSNASGNVLRFTPTVTTERVSATATVGGLSVVARRLAIYANVRNNGTAQFRLRIGIDPYADRGSYTPVVVIPSNGGTLSPKWIFCEEIALPPAGAYSLKVAITASATGLGTLDIDSIVTLDVTNPCNTVISVFKETSTSVFAITNLDIDHQLYSKPSAAIYPALSDYDKARAYQGNPFLSTKAAALYCLLMGTGSANSSFNYWRQTSGAGAVLNDTWSITREVGYLTPP